MKDAANKSMVEGGLSDRDRQPAQTVRSRQEGSAELLQRLICELEIHQEELRSQNEELRRAHLELIESRDRFIDLYDFAPVGYLTLSITGEILEANLTSCEMLGYERLRLIGMRLGTLCRVNGKETLHAHLDEVFDSEQRCSAELQIGREQMLDVQLESCRANSSGDGYHCRTIMTDITVRKRAERAANEKDRQLQSEMQERQRTEVQFREQQKQLMHIARVNTMGEMIAGIAHEINQPLHAISTLAAACEMKLLQAGAKPHDELPELLRLLGDQAVRSGDIIKRLRGFVKKSDATLLSLKVCDVIKDSVQLIEPEAREHGATVTVVVEDDRAEVFADPVQVQQVLVNLIKNAFESMAAIEGPRIVTVRAHSGENAVLISVADTGQGLAPETVDSLFQAFRSTKAEGLGLGLAISRSIVEAHGGRIWCTPNAQRGTVFEFTLPVPPAAQV